jgi:hypothetical protein
MSRGKRKLGENVWYEIRTALNDIEPLFWSGYAVWLLARVLSELSRFFPVEIRGLRFNGAMVMFYIRPKEGLKLPEIIKWVKLTFAVRFNLLDGRTGHIWGDRYRSRILDGEPPEWAEAYEFIEINLPVRRGDWRREAARIGWRCDRGNRKRYLPADEGAGLAPAPGGGGNPCVPAGFFRQSDLLAL